MDSSTNRQQTIISPAQYHQYLDSLLHGTRWQCRQVLDDLLVQGVHLKTIYQDLFTKSMHQVGELWERNRISVAVEHLATSITQEMITSLYPFLFPSYDAARLADSTNPRKAVVACVDNEYHQLGGQIVADFMQLNGLQSYFVGASTPTEDLLCLVDEKRPQFMAFSVSIYKHMPTLHRSLEEMRGNYRHIDILVGGQGLKHGGAESLRKHAHVEYVPTLDALQTYLGI